MEPQIPAEMVNVVYANDGINTGLIEYAAWTVTGAPTADLQGYAPLCTVFNQIDGTSYYNSGSAESATWSLSPSPLGNAVTAEISLTSAQILALNGTPVQLIAAPGTGKVVQILSVTGSISFLTAAYTTHTELDIIDTTAGSVLFKDTSILLAATNSLVAQIPASINSNAGLVVTTDGSVSVKAASGNPAAGSGTLKLYVTYKIITL